MPHFLRQWLLKKDFRGDFCVFFLFWAILIINNIFKTKNKNRDYRDVLGGNTPDKIDVTLDEEYHEMEVEMKPTRDELIARYQVSRW